MTITKRWVGVGEGEGDGLGDGSGDALGVGLPSGRAADVWPHAATRPISRMTATALMSSDTTIAGAVRLRGGPWEVEVIPERGGRITSLRLGGEELLDQGIGVDDPSATGYV